MKKVLLAWIEQYIEFDSEMEYSVFLQQIKTTGKKYKICQEEKMPDGKYRVNIRRQYNNNEFPAEAVTGCSINS